MTEVGFRRGIASPCIFYHEARDIRVVVHGDDFTALGCEEDLNWFHDVISKRFDMKSYGYVDDENSRVFCGKKIRRKTDEKGRYETRPSSDCHQTYRHGHAVCCRYACAS